MRQQRRPKGKVNRSVLQNRIKRDLYLVGKSSIIELIDEHHNDFDFIVVGNNYDSDKIGKIVSLSKKYGIEVNHSSDLLKTIEKEKGVDTSGIIVFLKRPIGKFYRFNEVLDAMTALDQCTVVAFPDVEYEQNIGAMIRTSVALGADFILVPNGQQKVFSSVVTKVSMGYNYLIPIVQENFLLAIEKLKDNDFDIYGLDMNGENIADMRYNSRVCFIVGNDGKGLSETTLKQCTQVLSIPMVDVVESLNVSASLAIALYDRMTKSR